MIHDPQSTSPPTNDSQDVQPAEQLLVQGEAGDSFLRPFVPPLEWAVEHVTPLALILGALAYLVGYNTLAVFADQLGIQPTVFGLDFRAYMVLSLGNLLRLAGAGAVGVAAYLAVRSAPVWVRALLAVLTGLAVVYLTLAIALEDTPTWLLLAPAALGGASMGLFFSAVRAASNPAARGALVLLVLISGWVFLVTSPESEARGWASELLQGNVDAQPATSLDLVISPVRVAVYGIGDLQANAGVPAEDALEDGTQVILLSESNGRAVIVDKGRVLVIDSTSLSSVAVP